MTTWTYLPDIHLEYEIESRTVTEYEITGEQIQVRPYTPEENAAADTALALAEQQKADAAAAADAAAISAAIAATTAPPPNGQPWTQPTGPQDAYPLDATVTHNGADWVSLVDYNVWEPGVSGWRENGDDIPEWVQPTGAHDAYAAGDIVRHIDKVWQSNIDANVWEPPEQWTEIPDPTTTTIERT